MLHLKDIKRADGDDIVLFIRDAASVPSAAFGWVTCDLYLDKITVEKAMDRRAAEDVFVYEHERFQTFIVRPTPEVSYKEYKCRGKGSFVLLNNWESFRRFLEQGK